MHAPVQGAHPARALIPAETTLVVPVASANVFGKRLNTNVHRPEIVSALSGAPLGNLITPEVVARVLQTRRPDGRACPRGLGSWCSSTVVTLDVARL